MDVGFVILCPDRNLGGIRNSYGSVGFNTYGRESLCVVPEDTTVEEMKTIKSFIPAHKGENTITSLINVGMKKNKHDWAFLFFAGSRLPPSIEKIIAVWANKDSDVVFPVVDRKWEFSSGSFNGVLINTKFFKEVGDFPDVSVEKDGLNDFEFAKLLWAAQAIEKGVSFKAIVGMKII